MTLRIQTKVLPGHRVEFTAPEFREGDAVQVFVVSARHPTPNRSELMQLPVEDRREIMRRQAENLAGEYDADPDREAWQGGDIVDEQ